MSLESTEAEAAAVAKAPRVYLADMEAKIAGIYEFTGDRAVGLDVLQHPALSVLSICILVMQNGFTIIGKAAPASAANFNADLGKKLAYEDAIRQLWPLEGYALRDRLAAEALAEALIA